MDISGNAPLMSAAVAGRQELVRLLLSHGALANATNHSGTSALWMSASAGQVDVVKVSQVHCYVKSA